MEKIMEEDPLVSEYISEYRKLIKYLEDEMYEIISVKRKID